MQRACVAVAWGTLMIQTFWCLLNHTLQFTLWVSNNMISPHLHFGGAQLGSCN